MRKIINSTFALMFGLFAVTLANISTASASIDIPLQLGSRSSEVTELQQFLATNRTIYPAGIVSGYYGPLTRDAVVQFQLAYDISPLGNVGPATRARINSIMQSGLGLDITAPTILTTNVSPTTNGAVLTLTTNENANSKLYYSTQPITLSEATLRAQEPTQSGILVQGTSNGTNSQNVNINGLLSNTLYYYSLSSIDASGNVTVKYPMTTFRTQ